MTVFRKSKRMQAQSDSDGVSSQQEARRLAFYLFWNLRSSYERCALQRTQQTLQQAAVSQPCQPLPASHACAL